jgi:hypothetical protein
MVLEQSTQVAELELSVARLQQREKRLRAVLSSAFTSRESRRDAREELETLLDKTEAADDELQLLGSNGGSHDGSSHDGNGAQDRVDPEERANSHRGPRTILRRRFRVLGRFLRKVSPA